MREIVIHKAPYRRVAWLAPVAAAVLFFGCRTEVDVTLLHEASVGPVSDAAGEDRSGSDGDAGLSDAGAPARGLALRSPTAGSAWVIHGGAWPRRGAMRPKGPRPGNGGATRPSSRPGGP